MTEVEPPLNVQQAAGLRALADAVEANPELGDILKAQIGYLSVVVSRDSARRMRVFAKALAGAGAVVDIDNGENECIVKARFGPVHVRAWARAEEMAGRVYSPAPSYPPVRLVESGEDTP